MDWLHISTRSNFDVWCWSVSKKNKHPVEFTFIVLSSPLSQALSSSERRNEESVNSDFVRRGLRQISLIIDLLMDFREPFSRSLINEGS